MKKVWLLETEQARWFEFEEPDDIGDMPNDMTCTLLTETEQPAQRTWVGLTDEEIDVAVKSCNTTDTYKYFRAIEAKLKEKNT